jgi:hypothetical protein
VYSTPLGSLVPAETIWPSRHISTNNWLALDASGSRRALHGGHIDRFAKASTVGFQLPSSSCKSLRRPVSRCRSFSCPTSPRLTGHFAVRSEHHLELSAASGRSRKGFAVEKGRLDVARCHGLCGESGGRREQDTCGASDAARMMIRDSSKIVSKKNVPTGLLECGNS